MKHIVTFAALLALSLGGLIVGAQGQVRGFVPVTDAMLQKPTPGDWLAWKTAIAEFVGAWRAAGSRRTWPAPSSLRTVHQLALELEQHYVDLVRTQLGREPQLAFEPGSDRIRARASASAPAAESGPRPRGWWQRLWS